MHLSIHPSGANLLQYSMPHHLSFSFSFLKQTCCVTVSNQKETNSSFLQLNAKVSRELITNVLYKTFTRKKPTLHLCYILHRMQSRHRLACSIVFLFRKKKSEKVDFLKLNSNIRVQLQLQPDGKTFYGFASLSFMNQTKRKREMRANM